MIDSNGNKYVLIRLVEDSLEDVEECDWSLVETNDEFAYSNWFSKRDFEIYKPYEIKQKYYTKNTKLSEDKLKREGYIKVISKTYTWAYKWFLDFIQNEKLSEIFSEIEYGGALERKFWKLVKKAGIRNEVFLVEDWLRVFLAVKWCQENHIAYKVDVPDEYIGDCQLREAKKIIRKKFSYYL